MSTYCQNGLLKVSHKYYFTKAFLNEDLESKY